MARKPPYGEYFEDSAHRAVYSRAACIYKRVPKGVLYPKGDEDLAWALARARELEAGLTMRAGGSGLAGQTVGEGIVADVSRYMSQIINVEPDRHEVVVEPGVVLSDLNRRLRPLGLSFAPDPSSADFCCIGGMLANNSKGPRSVKYGTTAQHVNWVRMLLADGSEIRLEKGSRKPDDYSHPALRRAAQLILSHRDKISSLWPRSRTNTSGYNLKDCLQGDGTVDLVPLFIGSEGTLAVFLEAGLRLTPIPAHRSLAMVEFATLEAAANAVVALLPHGPSACELMSETFLEIIRSGEGDFPLSLDKRSKAILLLEADGASREEAESGLGRLLDAAAPNEPVCARRAASAQEREAIWAFRKAASPLLNRGRGKLKSLRFIEDGAVPAEAIPRYVSGVTEILSARKIEAVIFGHAGDGNFHVNPFMDLTDSAHFEQMPLIAGEVARLLASLNGALSGEHGDGRLRTPYLPVVYGELTGLFRDIKLALDPQEILNPGILAPAQAEPIETGLRFSPAYRRAPLPGRLSEEAWAVEAERCHGCGTCRDFCPTAQASDYDLLSSRGRGHLLQALLAGELSLDDVSRSSARSVFDSCIGCSLCEINCPTHVDIAPLAAIFREAFTPPLQRARDAFLGRLPSLGYSVGPKAARMIQVAANTTPARAASRAAFGLRRDARAPKPAAAFAFDPGRLYHFDGRGAGKAAYFYGCFGNTYNPEGESGLAVSVLQALGVEVAVPPQACCGVSKMARGLFDAVAEDAAFNQRSFLQWTRKGFTIVASSPSCLFALSKEQPKFLPSEGAKELAGKCKPLFTYIKELMEARKPELREIHARVVYQTPCHGAVIGSYEDEVAVLKMIPGLEIADVTEECCGLGGSFGMEARHAELSDAIASPLMERIRRAAPDYVVTPCGSCKIQDEAHLQVPVLHPLVLLAEALGLKAGQADNASMK
ncbi:MAG: FAD-binding protein [Acidobacteria bacterium]|nr:FAD-binding protein [Acidobacteriota bacterium]